VGFLWFPYPPSDKFIGVDLNTTGHVAVVSNAETGKMWKLGKEANHISLKYKEIRRQLSRKGKYKKVRQIKNRQQRLIKNLNHRISKKIIQIAKDNNSGIRLEKLTNIRQRARTTKSFRYSLNNWSFYQLQKMIEYKAKLQGVAVSYIDPGTPQKHAAGMWAYRRQRERARDSSVNHVDTLTIC
jgi:IS605 OrfB family transposase